MSNIVVCDQLQREIDGNIVIRRLQLLRRSTDRGNFANTGRRYYDRHNYKSIWGGLTKAVRALPWFEVWALGLHSALLVLHAFVVMVALVE